MELLIFFAFIGGIVTILSPCILPILPIVLSGSFTGGKKRPYGIILGFIASFTFFTLLLSAIVKATGISADLLRNLSVTIIGLLGVTMLVPQTQVWLEQLFIRFTPQQKITSQQGFFGGILIGLSLGLIWAPCVGPILASVITLAATNQLNVATFIITLAYSIGTAIPLLLITHGGRRLLEQSPWLIQNSARIQKIFGVIMIFTAIAIYNNYDRRFQAYILEKFPQYGAGLTSIEDNSQVRTQLNQLKQNPVNLNPFQPKAPEITGGGAWLNSEPLTLANLRGKVVLIDFWTYSCINCIRTLPYLKAWHQKYQDQGLVIIGVHSPEFEFEKNLSNVRHAVEDFALPYPIVQDNDFLIWRSYDNRYWPAKYLIDKNGIIRYTHFGEGKYQETESKIQELLTETGASPNQSLIEISPIRNQAYTPETYLGYWRIEGQNISPSIQPDKLQKYSSNHLEFNQVGFDGDWLITEKYAESRKGSQLLIRYKSKEVFLVMRSTTPTSAKVYLDGQLVTSSQSGVDVKNSLVNIEKDRLYHLITGSNAQEHLLTIEFLNDATEVYAFTFG